MCAVYFALPEYSISNWDKDLNRFKSCYVWYLVSMHNSNTSSVKKHTERLTDPSVYRVDYLIEGSIDAYGEVRLRVRRAL